MKSAIYIEAGDTQIVLTPENEFERLLVENLAAKTKRMAVHLGGFYVCQGGWHRRNVNNDSLCLRLVENEVIVDPRGDFDRSPRFAREQAPDYRPRPPFKEPLSPDPAARAAQLSVAEMEGAIPKADAGSL